MLVGTLPPVHQPQTISSRENAGQRFVDLYTLHFQRLVEDAYQRVEQTKKGTIPEGGWNPLLERGIWYPSDYYEALKKFKKAKRLSFMENNGMFFHGMAPQEVVSSVSDSKSLTGKKLVTYQVKKEVTATQALEGIEKGLSFLDCGTMCQLAAYRALKELMPDKFDRLFAADSETPFCVSADQQFSPIMRVFDERKITREEDIQKGDRFFVSNIQAFLYKNPASHMRGIFLVCKATEGAKRHLGFGLDPAGVDVHDVERTLWQYYNEEPILDGFYPNEVWKQLYKKFYLQDEQKSRAFLLGQKNTQLTWEQFRQEPLHERHDLSARRGNLLLEVSRPSLQRIEEVAQASLDDVANVFNSFVPISLTT